MKPVSAKHANKVDKLEEVQLQSLLNVPQGCPSCSTRTRKDVSCSSCPRRGAVGGPLVQDWQRRRRFLPLKTQSFKLSFW